MIACCMPNTLNKQRNSWNLFQATVVTSRDIDSKTCHPSPPDPEIWEVSSRLPSIMSFIMILLEWHLDSSLLPEDHKCACAMLLRLQVVNSIASGCDNCQKASKQTKELKSYIICMMIITNILLKVVRTMKGKANFKYRFKQNNPIIIMK